MPIKSVLSALLVMFLWGSAFSAIKIGLSDFSPVLLSAIRYFTAGLLIMPFVEFPRRDIKIILLMSLLLCLNISFMYMGLQYTDSGTASIIVQLATPISAFIATVFYKETLGLNKLIGIMISFAGVIVLTDINNQSNVYASLMMIVGAIFSGLLANMVRHVKYASKVALNGYIAFFGSLMMLVFSLVIENNHLETIASASINGWLSILFTALVVSILADSIWYNLLQKYPVNLVVPFCLLIPLIGVLIGCIFLGESFTLDKIWGSVLIISGIFIVQFLNKSFWVSKIGKFRRAKFENN